LNNKIFKGFTLSELLVALSVLSIISTFTLVKVVSANQVQQNKAKFKELYSTLSNIVYEGRLYGTVKTQLQFSQALQNKVSFLKFCPTNAVANGCWDSTMYQATGEGLEGGGILHNGLYMAGVSNTNAANDYVVVDLNGPSPPNQLGQDTFALSICLNTQANVLCQPGAGYTSFTYTGVVSSGTILPGAGSDALFHDLLK
jgi:prepilin-type N-terminal cleavage/methylation domain-containing protein